MEIVFLPHFEPKNGHFGPKNGNFGYRNCHFEFKIVIHHLHLRMGLVVVLSQHKNGHFEPKNCHFVA